jgi:hypothetical protein
MQKQDFNAFAELLASTAAMYERALSEGVITLYWEGLKGYELNAVREAFHRHLNDPDAGRFMPKLADIHRAMRDTSGT